MTPKPARAKSTLTHEEFGNLLRWLSSDDETSTRMFLEISKELRKWFVWKGSTHAEDLVDETMDRVAKILLREPGKYPNMMALFRKVARLVWLEDINRNPPLDELDPEKFSGSAPDLENWYFKECEEECMKEGVDSLPERERHLITQYFSFRGQEKIVVRKHLAEGHGGLGNLRTKACRIRIRLNEDLDDCIGECMNRKQSTEMR
jgi:DNA-directed RNA polymerase specialized sigma24 family protein